MTKTSIDDFWRLLGSIISSLTMCCVYEAYAEIGLVVYVTKHVFHYRLLVLGALLDVRELGEVFLLDSHTFVDLLGFHPTDC